MKTYYEVTLPNGVTQICTRAAIDELPSVCEFIRDARANGLLGLNEYPKIVCRNRQLSKKRIDIIIRETSSPMKLIFVNYWDVWGNAREGFEVNNVSRHTLTGKIPESPQAVLRLLKENEIIHKTARIRSFSEIDFQCSGIELTERSGRPFGRIEWEV